MCVVFRHLRQLIKGDVVLTFKEFIYNVLECTLRHCTEASREPVPDKDVPVIKEHKDIQGTSGIDITALNSTRWYIRWKSVTLVRVVNNNKTPADTFNAECADEMMCFNPEPLVPQTISYIQFNKITEYSTAFSTPESEVEFTLNLLSSPECSACTSTVFKILNTPEFYLHRSSTIFISASAMHRMYTNYISTYNSGSAEYAV